MEVDDLERLKKILIYYGVNTFAFGVKCPAITKEMDGLVFKIKGVDYRIVFLQYSYIGDDLNVSPVEINEDEIDITNVNIQGVDIPIGLDKFIVLSQNVNGSIMSFLCDNLYEDYTEACTKKNLIDITDFYAKISNDILSCISAKEITPGGFILSNITNKLRILRSEARSNQEFEFAQNGFVYRLNGQNQAEIIDEPLSDADLNSGNWNGSVDLKMRVGFNGNGILQFTAIGIRKDLPIASGKTASLTEISANMLTKNNALLIEYQIKDISATLNSVGANLDSEAFPDGKKVAIDKKATFIKVLCEAGGIGLSFLKTAEIEQPVYLTSENNTTIKAPPIGTGALEAGAMAVTDITSLVTTIHDLVTDKQARADAVAGLKAIKDQVVDQPTILFPILGEVALQELTGTGAEGYKEMVDGTTDTGRKGHLITKTSVRTTVSVFTSGKFLAKLPDMAVKIAKKMPKAKLWLRFRSISDDLAETLLTKFDELSDGGNKFLNDFAGASDDVLGKLLNKPELVDAWKKMDNLGADDVVRRNPDAIDAFAKKVSGEKVPEPDTYLDVDYIQNHLSKFDDGAVRFTTDAYPTLGNKEAFVIPKSEFDNLMIETGGDLALIEKKLVLNDGTLTGKNIVIAWVKKKDFGEIKMPSGNEAGAISGKWIPGGKTAGGVSEGVIDLSNPDIPKKLFPF